MAFLFAEVSSNGTRQSRRLDRFLGFLSPFVIGEEGEENISALLS